MESAKKEISLVEAQKRAVRIIQCFQAQNFSESRMKRDKELLWFDDIRVCGSIRRKLDAGLSAGVVGDIDIALLIPRRMRMEEVGDRIVVLLSEIYAVRVLRKGSVKLSIVTSSLIKQEEGIQVDFSFTDDPAGWGAFILHNTGTAGLNMRMRAEAKAKGLKLNEYGLWKGEERIAGRTEEAVFALLGWSYLRPCERENF